MGDGTGRKSARAHRCVSRRNLPPATKVGKHPRLTPEATALLRARRGLEREFKGNSPKGGGFPHRNTLRMKPFLNALLLLALSSAGLNATDKSTAPYPLTTCVVSGEGLTEMGEPLDFIYKQEGKPDRLVKFCCKQCIGKFKKDPAKYLAKLDAAAAEAAKK
jgi:hypothetical protein